MAADGSPGKGVKRRTVLRGLATGFAGAVAAPHVATPSETPAPVVQSTEPEQTEAPRLLSEHDRGLLTSLCEALVPGSVAAGVPELIDRVAAVETPETQRALLASVRAFEAEARARHAAPWMEIDGSARNAILESAASGAPAKLHQQFVRLRQTVAETYFATEPGMRELGWTPRTAWRELPRCEHTGDNHGEG